MAKLKKNKNKFLVILSSLVAIVLGLAIGLFTCVYINLPLSFKIPETETNLTTGSDDKTNVESITSNDLSIHFLELGNKYTGDCILIKVGNTEILVDAGSKASSIPTLKSYIDNYCTDGILEYVIVTHAHEDHYAGFATNSKTDSIFDLYQIGTIIEFAKTNKTNTQTMQANYLRECSEAEEKGTKIYNALDCYEMKNDAQRIYDLGKNVKLEILYQRYYKETATTENDYSVCFMINQNDSKYYLFTGDLEAKGEASLVDNNTLFEVELFKAGHHGSKTSSTDKLLSKIKPKIVAVCCCSGSSEYTQVSANQFPTQDFINRIAMYTDKVFVTTLCVDYKNNIFESMNGNIVICSTKAIKIYCSNNSTLLKDTLWFIKNRITPSIWMAS